MPDLGAFFTATIKRQIAPNISDAIIKKNCALKMLKEKGAIHTGKGGDGFEIRARYAESTVGGASSDLGTQNIQTTQPFVKLTNVYRQYRWTIGIPLFQSQRNENAGMEAKMFEMITEQTAEVKQTAITRIGKHIYTGTTVDYPGDISGMQINGLEEIIHTTNTYFGVDRSQTANAYWRANREAAGVFLNDDNSNGVVNGIETLNTLWTDCSTGGKQTGKGINADIDVEKDVPDYVITTAAGFNAFRVAMQGAQRFTGKGADPALTLAYEGYPVEWDAFCPAGVMYVVNTRHLDYDVVGSKMIDLLFNGKIPNPLMEAWVLGGQYQFYSRNPRYLGRMSFS